MTHLIGLRKKGRKFESMVVVRQDDQYTTSSAPDAKPADVPDEDLQVLRVFIKVFHGDWNWTFKKV